MNLPSELSSATRRRGYCPGVWTPMRSGDGLIVRVRTSVRWLTASQLRSLAELAERHGNGLIELTRRANLQLRGVSEASLEPLQHVLVELGLADASEAREKQLAPLLVDPYVELDELARQLEDLLAREGAPLDLPSKLGLILEASDALRGTPADLRLRYQPADDSFDLSVAGEGASPVYLGSAQRQDSFDAVSTLLVLISEAQRAGHTRMRDLTTQLGVDALRAQLPMLRVQARKTAEETALPQVGLVAGERPHLGLALPFGAGTASAFRAIAELAERARGVLRVTPARTVLIPGLVPADRAWVLAHAHRHGLIVDPQDPLLFAVACAGAPACGSALGETRALATALTNLAAPLLNSGALLHVSGCPKSCAHGGPAALTLVHTADGLQLGVRADVAETQLSPALPLESVRQRLTAMARDVRVPPPMSRHYEYEHNGAEIYRRSFAIIRSEARLSRFSNPIEERVAVRLIHTSGMVDLADDVLFTPGFAEAATAAVRAGAPILCDANMIVSGVTRSRLSARNDVLCFLDDPSVPGLAADQKTTRSAAALTLWRERMNGAVVAIGNAPTALFRLLELFDETDVRPAAVIGLPVGFVGAAESKEALLADGRVPSMIVRGRRGGSAMTVAAINALASDKE